MFSCLQANAKTSSNCCWMHFMQSSIFKLIKMPPFYAPPTRFWFDNKRSHRREDTAKKLYKCYIIPKNDKPSGTFCWAWPDHIQWMGSTNALSSKLSLPVVLCRHQSSSQDSPLQLFDKTTAFSSSSDSRPTMGKKRRRSNGLPSADLHDIHPELNLSQSSNMQRVVFGPQSLPMLLRR
jgi:hypothetical protein